MPQIYRVLPKTETNPFTTITRAFKARSSLAKFTQVHKFIDLNTWDLTLNDVRLDQTPPISSLTTFTNIKWTTTAY